MNINVLLLRPYYEKFLYDKNNETRKNMTFEK